MRPGGLGRVGYRALAGAVKVLFPIRRSAGPASPARVLVIGSGGIGDIVMKTPLLACLRGGFPRAEIVLFTSPGPECEIIRGHPAVDRIITLEDREALSLRAPGQMLAWLRKLRTERFDISITTHYGISFRAAFFSYLVGAPTRVGFDRGGRGSLYNVRVAVGSPGERHAVEWNLDLARALGLGVESPALSVALAPREREAASALLRGCRIGDGRRLLVGIFPGSKRSTRLWRSERFAAVADALAEAYRADILLLGGPGERAAVAEIERAMRAPAAVAVGQSVRDTAALIERCGLVISTDSGPMHLAAALGAPVVALFGPETPVRVGPWTDHAAVIQHDFACSPCHTGGCRLGTNACMEAITVDDVLEAVRANSERWGLEPFRRC